MSDLNKIIQEALQRFLIPITKWIANADATKTVDKDVQLSRNARAKGDKLFAEDNPDLEHQHKIIRLYNESIAYAPLESEDLAKAYANKSALLRRMRRYAECDLEADNALKITKLTSMKIKLLCRKADCLTALGSTENRSCLEKAKFFMTRSEIGQESEKMKKMLQKLIEKTQVIVDADKLDAPKEAKKYSQTSKLVADAEKKDVQQNTVRVNRSEKFGAHFVAARDLEPGEIILLEKPYRCHLQLAQVYQYCCQCYSYLWTVVPCDTCNWRLYCSEKCKNESWNEYHELECSVLSRFKKLINPELVGGYVVFSIFFKTLKEAGGLSKLRADLESIDKVTGFGVDDSLPEQVLTYEKIYTSLVVDKLKDKESLLQLSENAVIHLMVLARYTKILNKAYNLHEMRNLMKNDTAIFLGTLLLKLNMIVMRSRIVGFQLIDPTNLMAQSYTPGTGVAEKFLSYAFEASSLLAMHGCIPNVKAGLTREHLSVWHTLQPIKKGDRIIIYNASSAIYDNVPKSTRQRLFQQYHNCACDCRACTENWRFDGLEPSKVSSNAGSNTEMVEQIVGELNYIDDEIKKNSRKFKNPDIKTVSRVKDLVVKAWKHCELPSPVIIRAVKLYHRILGWFYGPSESEWK